VARKNTRTSTGTTKEGTTPATSPGPTTSPSLREYLEIPRDVLCVVVGKSTYARCGLLVLVTPLEPEWKGKVTVEVANTTPLPAKVYVNEGIMQGMFFRTDGVTEALVSSLHYLADKGSALSSAYASPQLLEVMANTYDLLRCAMEGSTCQISYADKKGIYQDQKGLTLPTVSEEEKKGG
jgi:deoxycytidine triphosphate deaminase